MSVDIVTAASDATTFEPVVTNAAVIAALVPEVAMALETVTVPEVVDPIALKSVMVIEAAEASVNVTTDEPAVTFDPAVTNAAFASATVPEIAIAFDAVTVPVVSLQ